jgi:hypothetical protein
VQQATGLIYAARRNFDSIQTIFIVPCGKNLATAKVGRLVQWVAVFPAKK